MRAIAGVACAAGFAFRALCGLLLVVTFVCPLPAEAAPSYPLTGFADSASYTFYVNEEVLVRGTGAWRTDGSLAGNYSLSMAGQKIEVTLSIVSDAAGIWNSMAMTTPSGNVTVTRNGDTALITTPRGAVTVQLKPETRLFENFTPYLMSQVILGYDQHAAGKQTFPLFIIPSAVVEASLERLDTVERTVKGQPQMFTRYRFSLPGVDVILWADDGMRMCLGEVPSQHGRYVREGYELLAEAPPSDSLLSQPRYEVVVDTNVMVPMRDGVKLAADFYRPATDGKFPVVLVRTPYGKQMSELQGKYFARRGYVYAVQDCRGRFGSEGTWRPFFAEPNDGYDAIEWVAKQSWSNGKVGMIGASYLGWVQWWAASQHPPHLVTMIPNVAPPDPYYNIPYEYGSFFLLGAIWWADVLQSEATTDISGQAMSSIWRKKYVRLLRDLPVIDLDKTVLGKENPYWREWIANPNNDSFWEPVNFLGKLDKVAIPVYHQSGWYDGDGIGSKLNYRAMASHRHPYQKLVLGPWGHTDQASRTGPFETDFGPDAIIDLPTSYLRWLDRWLLGIDNGIEKEPLVSLFVMGSNKWLHGDTYPLPETEFTKLYLTSEGTANTSNGTGRLGFMPPTIATVPSDTFTYNPADPTPDPGFYFEPHDMTADTADDTATVAVEVKKARARAFHGEVTARRPDILVYETPAFTQPLTMAGPVSAVLYAATSAKDTDWFVALHKVLADGTVYPLVRGVIRARFRESMSSPTFPAKDQVYPYTLDLWQTGVTVMAGEKLRVEVSSAAFPTYSRNLNTGGHNEMETDYVTARQTIAHAPDFPSHILLPVIPNPQFK